MKIRILPTHAS